VRLTYITVGLGRGSWYTFIYVGVINILFFGSTFDLDTLEILRERESSGADTLTLNTEASFNLWF